MKIARYLTGTMLSSAALLAMVPSVATAQNATPTPSTGAPSAQADDQREQDGDIVITGTLFKGANDTPSPVSTITAESLDRRGISTVQDALQTLASNNGPALTNSFSANGAFAAGASAVSLRGLSTNSTLVLFDGLRAAYYPLADDGSRNFVDLNTIPDDIVDRIEVLRDGASSTYGADAIAGVVNIITKREFKGVSGRVEGGVTERGDAPTYRLNLTAGVGDLDEQGFNAYISGFYYKQKALFNRDRGYPFNTADHRATCQGTVCGPNGVSGGLNNAGVYAGGTPTASIFYVRPYDPTNTTPAAGSRFISEGNVCPGTPYTLTAAELASASNVSAPTTICQADYTNLYGMISPNIKRFAVSGRITAKIGDSLEAYAEVNFLQSEVSFTGNPATVRGTANTGILYQQFSTSNNPGGAIAAGSGILALPVYVCPRNGQTAVLANGVATLPGGCTAATPGAVLNPNNPFAAAGQVARVVGRDLSQVTDTSTRNRAYRVALGVNGDLFDGWSFNVAATAMHDDLLRRTDGFVYIQHLLDVIADGTYNFRNPSATPQSVQDYLTPVNRTNATSDQYQLQASVNTKLFDLPGGALQLGFGGSIRYEAVDAPSANADYNGPTQRYFTLNAFGTKGSRYIYSAFAELDAPIVDMLDINASGRYDSYSSGQSAFSPKVGFKFTPIRQITLRGTYSRGFRIPSFGEANALPTTGFVSVNPNQFTNAFLAPYAASYGVVCTVQSFNTCPAYIRAAVYGQTTLASPNLKPEKSRSFTGGIKFNPVKNVEITVDYYNIRKTGAITQPSNSPALLAYYNNQPIPAGYTVVVGAPDPNTPLGRPVVGFVQAQLINADTIKTSGLDMSIDTNFDLGFVKWNSSAAASVILLLQADLRASGGVVERYDGTLGNFNLTAGSGTPKWHGSWLNTFDFGDIVISGTVNFFGGYDLSAMDQGTQYKDCGLSTGITPCRVKSLITFDMNAQFRVAKQFTLYMNVINLFDRMPPIDPVTYGANYYNAVQGGTAIYGRMFKAGAKFSF